ncbi:beta-mannosidase [Aphidius gifuensis]|uniref:beta-mannosidase n=1 Tax=Aphidius gifuensis TaxID=684658 RepID=UPI001CDCB53E|nr:beta-mannosidase [Aphidius gifuensis]
MKIILIIYSIICFVYCKKINNDWYVQITGEHNYGINTSIPQDSYSIIPREQIDDPLVDDNDLIQRWIGNSSVTFTNYFSLTDDEYDAERIILVFHGVDTFGKILLNDNIIGYTSNMFIRYVFDVKKYIKKDRNTLTVILDSPIKKATEAFENQSKNYTVYPTCVPSSYKGECHVNHIRKMQASFSWDWGPAIPSSGIWRDVEIVAVKDATIIDHTIDVYLDKNNKWIINVTVGLEVVSNSPTKPVEGILEVILIIDDQPKQAAELISCSKNISISSGVNETVVSVSLTVDESKILRWWPNGYGKQNLYKLNTTLTTSSSSSSITKTKRIGFRTVELVQKPLANGLSFYFNINGISIFAKGSNMIPTSIFIQQSNNKTIREHLLRYSKEANMNMMRIWGGGIYETDEFYDIADEYGIMIWQDFMFACSMYPTNEEFIESVKIEVKQNLWRLKTHVSIVIWAGNNENEAALYGNWYGTKDSKIYRDDYIKLYVDTIKLEINKYDLTRPYIVSSPTNGKYSDDNDYVKTDPYLLIYGDTHRYNYFLDGWDILTYEIPRFSSEYGFQSYPSIVTLGQASKKPNEDLVLDSKFLKHRQHLLGGDQYMKLLIAKNLNIPKTNNSKQDFESYVYLSQVNQAQAMKVQTESYRQTKSSINDAGEGMTMGALYWQLNDVWAAPTWSSIDYIGRWKLLHHYAVNFFAPVIVSSRVTLANDIVIYIITDLLTDLGDCFIDVNVYKLWNNIQTNYYTFKVPGIYVGANKAIEVTTLSVDELMKRGNCTDDNCIFELVLKNQSGKQLAPVNYAYPVSPKHIDLPACKLIASIDSSRQQHNEFYDKHRVTVKSACSQLFVQFDAGGYFTGRFSDNGFHMLHGDKKKLYFYIDKSKNIENIIQTFTLVALGQIYQNPMLTNDICLDCLN